MFLLIDKPVDLINQIKKAGMKVTLTYSQFIPKAVIYFNLYFKLKSVFWPFLVESDKCSIYSNKAHLCSIYLMHCSYDSH